MLVLSRKLNESIMIGDDIEVSVVYIGANRVQLGINAPGDISVHRMEIFNVVQAQAGKDIQTDQKVTS